MLYVKEKIFPYVVLNYVFIGGFLTAAAGRVYAKATSLFGERVASGTI